MPWDPTNAKFVIAPNAWSKGNGTSDKNTGNFPSYPNGAYQNCVLTNMAIGYGFVYNTEDGYLKFDGNDDYANCNDVLELNSVSKFTIEFIMNQDVLDVADIIFRKEYDNINRIKIYTHTNGDMYFHIDNVGGKYGKFDYSTKISAGINAHVVMVFDGTLSGNENRLKVFVNDEQITLTFSGTIPATTYNLTAENVYVGYSTNSFAGKIYWFAIYSDALISSRISTNFAFGADMGMIGNNASDSMVLAPFKFNVLPFDSESEYIPAFQNKTCYNCICSQPAFVAKYCLDVSEPHVASCPLCSHDPQLPVNIPVCSNCEHGL